MDNQFIRLENLIGKENCNRIKNAKIAIFGIGGVGGYVLEALVRSGVGEIDIIDNDDVCPTNLNRQIIALNSTIGAAKVDIAEKRAIDINPQVKINKFKVFYTEETKKLFEFTNYCYVIDAIDFVAGKISLIEECKKVNTPIISAMGAGNKINPTLFKVADISKTSVCPLARVMRQELRKRNIKGVKVVYSTEEPTKTKDRITASNAICPSVMGLLIANEVLNDIMVGVDA